mmetsp:Transcript_23829/g.33377  ORF Transcript_23829/g.33377 Transcript_23829/m.33377 type:complete len:202 (-) Transcript_23829:95-700(-)
MAEDAKLAADSRRAGSSASGLLALKLATKYMSATDMGLTSRTCREMRQACERESKRRCLEMDFDRHYSWTKLLRASEMVCGELCGPRVPIPVQCSTRSVLVNNAGYQPVNGEYFNSGMCVNGRVFTRTFQGDTYIMRKLYSGNQLFWYLSRNSIQLYWANIPFMESAMVEVGYPPVRGWGAMREELRPGPVMQLRDRETKR